MRGFFGLTLVWICLASDEIATNETLRALRKISTNETRKLPDKVLQYRYGIPEDNTPVHFHLAFAGPSGMAITWETDSDTPTHTCKYGNTPTDLSFIQTGSSYTYGTMFSHKVVLTSLKTSLRYYYSCGDATFGMSSVKNFITAPMKGDKTPFALALIGDMGIKQSDGVSASMELHQDSYNFVLDVGDLGYADDWYLYFSTYDKVYAAWMDQIENISSNRAFMVLPGNHEATCQEVLPSFCGKTLSNFSTYHTRWRMPSQESGGVSNMWHSFDYGLIHFIQLSTETDFPNAPEGPNERIKAGPFGDQLTWLQKDLAAAVANRATVPWIIVSGHRPIWFSASADPAVQKAFLPLLTDYKVDIYFSGHKHDYERYYPINSNGTVCQQSYTNSPCPIYIVNGAGGNVEGHESGRGSPAYLVFRDNDHYGWGRLSLLNASTLKWEFITDEDKIVDTIFISKNV